MKSSLAMRPGRSALTFCLAILALVTFDGLAQQPRDPILVLVSFDGWRWDYIHRAHAPNLRALASRGVRAEGLIPSFPPKTFPNHYTIVTGLFPERHGIVANTFVEPGFPERFSLSAETAKDARWWGGEPLWVTAIRQRRRAAPMFWPGSEVPIAGVWPTYWKPFDDAMPNAERVRQVLDWLALPATERPSFVTLYFSEVDSAGHEYGPDSQEVLDAAARLDQALGDLVAGVEKLDLLEDTTFIVVSDHGMSQLSDRRIIYLDDYLDLSTVDVIEWTPTLGLAPRSGSVEDVYRRLKGKHPALAIYKREQVPASLHYRDNPRIPPIVGLSNDGWAISTHDRVAADRKAGRKMGGAHGYDPKHRAMHGLFVAAGPRVRQGLVVPAFQNVHIYEFMCRILGLLPAPNDGDASVTEKWLVEQRPAALFKR